jgi:hypothetical protein
MEFSELVWRRSTRVFKLDSRVAYTAIQAILQKLQNDTESSGAKVISFTSAIPSNSINYECANGL